MCLSCLNRCAAVVILALVACAFVVGCGGGGVSRDNYNDIRMNAPLADVEKLMGGKGTEVTVDWAKKNGVDPAGDGKLYRWGDDTKWVVVRMTKEDKLVFKTASKDIK